MNAVHTLIVTILKIQHSIRVIDIFKVPIKLYPSIKISLQNLSRRTPLSDDYQCDCMDGFYGTGKQCWDYDEERFRIQVF